MIGLCGSPFHVWIENEKSLGLDPNGVNHRVEAMKEGDTCPNCGEGKMRDLNDRFMCSDCSYYKEKKGLGW